jgi:hypothetical protein
MYVDPFVGLTIPFLTAFPLNMLAILPLVLLALFHQEFQPIQAASVALPLAMCSPFLSCWLPQINGFANAIDSYPSSIYQVSFLKFNSNGHL